MSLRVLLPALGLAALLAGPLRAQGASYLYAWSGDADTLESDFLAVIDVRPASPTYGEVVHTVPVAARATMPHHTEHQLEPDGVLFANGYAAGRTFRFDMRNAAAPVLAGSFGEQDGYSYPHSFVRLPNGHVLATFQGRGDARTPPGGLVEMDREGRVIRSGSARDTTVDSLHLRPYSLAVVPALDRVVSTSTDMSGDYGAHVQVWRYSDLALLATIPLPETRADDAHRHVGEGIADGEAHHRYPGEPRLLADGRTVLLGTFSCGFYRITGLDAEPRAEFVQAFGGMDCAVPALIGTVWIQTVPDEHALVAMDVSDPAAPREVSRLVFDGEFRPHWLAADEAGSRVAVNDGRGRLHLVRVDRTSGALTLDESFRDRGAATPGVNFARPAWPHGASGPARPHGAVFSRP